MSAKAGIHTPTVDYAPDFLDSRLRGNDILRLFPNKSG